MDHVRPGRSSSAFMLEARCFETDISVVLCGRQSAYDGTDEWHLDRSNFYKHDGIVSAFSSRRINRELTVDYFRDNTKRLENRQLWDPSRDIVFATPPTHDTPRTWDPSRGIVFAGEMRDTSKAAGQGLHITRARVARERLWTPSRGVVFAQDMETVSGPRGTRSFTTSGSSSAGYLPPPKKVIRPKTQPGKREPSFTLTKVAPTARRAPVWAVTPKAVSIRPDITVEKDEDLFAPVAKPLRTMSRVTRSRFFGSILVRPRRKQPKLFAEEFPLVFDPWSLPDIGPLVELERPKQKQIRHFQERNIVQKAFGLVTSFLQPKHVLQKTEQNVNPAQVSNKPVARKDKVAAAIEALIKTHQQAIKKQAILRQAIEDLVGDEEGTIKEVLGNRYRRQLAAAREAAAEEIVLVPTVETSQGLDKAKMLSDEFSLNSPTMTPEVYTHLRVIGSVSDKSHQLAVRLGIQLYNRPRTDVIDDIIEVTEFQEELEAGFAMLEQSLTQVEQQYRTLTNIFRSITETYVSMANIAKSIKGLQPVGSIIAQMGFENKHLQHWDRRLLLLRLRLEVTPDLETFRWIRLQQLSTDSLRAVMGQARILRDLNGTLPEPDVGERIKALKRPMKPVKEGILAQRIVQRMKSDRVLGRSLLAVTKSSHQFISNFRETKAIVLESFARQVFTPDLRGNRLLAFAEATQPFETMLALMYQNNVRLTTLMFSLSAEARSTDIRRKWTSLTVEWYHRRRAEAGAFGADLAMWKMLRWERIKNEELVLDRERAWESISGTWLPSIYDKEREASGSYWRPIDDLSLDSRNLAEALKQRQKVRLAAKAAVALKEARLATRKGTRNGVRKPAKKLVHHSATTSGADTEANKYKYWSPYSEQDEKSSRSSLSMRSANSRASDQSSLSRKQATADKLAHRSSYSSHQLFGGKWGLDKPRPVRPIRKRRVRMPRHYDFQPPGDWGADVAATTADNPETSSETPSGTSSTADSISHDSEVSQIQSGRSPTSLEARSQFRGARGRVRRLTSRRQILLAEKDRIARELAELDEEEAILASRSIEDLLSHSRPSTSLPESSQADEAGEVQSKLGQFGTHISIISDANARARRAYSRRVARERRLKRQAEARLQKETALKAEAALREELAAKAEAVVEQGVTVSPSGLAEPPNTTSKSNETDVSSEQAQLDTHTISSDKAAAKARLTTKRRLARQRRAARKAEERLNAEASLEAEAAVKVDPVVKAESMPKEEAAAEMNDVVKQCTALTSSGQAEPPTTISQSGEVNVDRGEQVESVTHTTSSEDALPRARKANKVQSQLHRKAADRPGMGVAAEADAALRMKAVARGRNATTEKEAAVKKVAAVMNDMVVKKDTVREKDAEDIEARARFEAVLRAASQAPPINEAPDTDTESFSLSRRKSRPSHPTSESDQQSSSTSQQGSRVPGSESEPASKIDWNSFVSSKTTKPGRSRGTPSQPSTARSWIRAGKADLSKPQRASSPSRGPRSYSAQAASTEGPVLAGIDTSELSDFKLCDQAIHAATAAAQAVSSTPFWEHSLYRDSKGKKPLVHYCRSAETSEKTARLFLKSPVLGFDMEWRVEKKTEDGKHMRRGIRDNVSVIQMSNAERIAVFHIAAFKTVDNIDTTFPTLRKIMETPTIIKAGVNIKGDCTRLQKNLGITSSGVFELSHLYKLVEFAHTTPDLINRKPVGLAQQVQQHLGGLPLSKEESVRSGDWSRKLSWEQCQYAASDAYAGYQLFLALEAKRRAMKPTPPRPAFAELNLPIDIGEKKVVVEEKEPAVTEEERKDDEKLALDASVAMNSESKETGRLEPIVLEVGQIVQIEESGSVAR